MNAEENQDLDLGSMSLLVHRAREGDSSARNAICHQVRDHLQIQADKHLDDRLRRKLNPSDIVQQALTRMINGFEDFRGATSNEFYAWLNMILRNEIHSVRRENYRQRRDVRREQPLARDLQPDVEPVSNLPSAESVSRHREKLERFRQVVGRLPNDYARVIEMRGLEELPFAEVAERMDRSLDSVTKLWSRALVRLSDELAKLDESIT